MGSSKSKNATKPLTDKEIELLSSQTGLSKRDVQEWHKKFLVDYPDGFIDKKEFTNLYKQLYSYGNPTKFAEFAFKAFDDDNNGRISFSEFLISTSFLIKPGSPREQEIKRLELAFDVFDVNDDQKIDKKELQKLYEALFALRGAKPEHAKDKVNELFKKYDRDSSGSLNRQEFVTALNHENVFSFF